VKAIAPQRSEDRDGYLLARSERHFSILDIDSRSTPVFVAKMEYNLWYIDAQMPSYLKFIPTGCL
jgi:hypothetical protein